MKFIRYNKNEVVQAALVTDEQKVYPIPVTDYVEFYYELKGSNRTAQQYIQELGIEPLAEDVNSLQLTLPIVPDEVWASGVTYLKSREARNYEATRGQETQQETFYDKVYDAERPEIFMKATARRTVGPQDAVFIRNDSQWQIPEPELTLIIGKGEEIIGYTLGNDMSCRDIEGENPLYLPQAKVWKNSCSIGPAILLPEAIDDPYSIDINCKIYRDEQVMFEGTAYVNQLKRKLEELVHYLVYENDLVPGTALMTGTCVVPGNDFTLLKGDKIEISSSKIGTLVNYVDQN